MRKSKREREKEREMRKEREKMKREREEERITEIGIHEYIIDESIVRERKRVR